MLSQGDVLKKKYRILRKIGSGGMSTVWLAEDIDLKKQWAIKEIDKSTEEFKRNVNVDGSLTEVEILKRLDHPFAPRVTDIYENRESICVVMDYIEGESLQRILNRMGPPKQEVVISWVIDVCKLLHFLHSKNIIYRDIKPANIILTETGSIKVVDFGIAKIVRNKRYFDAAPLGTRGYASPEHAAKCTTELSDIYTVGVTLYQLLTGVSPTKKGFTIMPLKTINPELSSGLDEIIMKATRRDPKERYQSMTALIDALTNYKKLEQPYIAKLKKKIAVSKALLIAAVSMLSIGFLGFVGIEFYEIREYNSLINTGSFIGKEQQESYEEAILLRPNEEEAYLRILESFEDSFSKAKLNSFLDLYDNYYEPNKLIEGKSYARFNYEIAESILSNYSGLAINSVKDRLLLVKPFLERASYCDTEYSAYANAYLALAKKYEEFDTKLSISETEGAEIVQALRTITSNKSQEFGKGTIRKQLTAYEIAMKFIGDNLDILRKAKVTSDIKKIVIQTEDSVGSLTISKENQQLYAEVLSALADAKRLLNY